MKVKTITRIFVAGMVACVISIAFPNSVKAQKKEEIKEVKIWASLDCESCKKKVEREIAFEKGVNSISANLEEKVITIKYKADKNSDEKLADAIKKLGYDVKILNNEEKKGEKKSNP